MAVNQTISSLPIPGKRGVDVREVFVDKTEAFHDALEGTTVTQLNKYASELNATETNINNKETSAAASAATATTAKDIAVGIANYQGDWVAGSYSISESVSYTDGFRYVSKINLNTFEPSGVTDANWYKISSGFNYVAKSANYTALANDFIYADTRKIAQVDTVTVVTVANSTLHTVTINAVPYSYTSDTDATNAEIVAGLIAAINAGTEPVTASGTTTVILTADVAGTAFSTTVTAQLSVATTTANKVGSFTVTLPATPSVNDVVAILDNKSSFATNPLSVARNGKNIMGLAEDMVVDTNNISFELIYNGIEWRLV